MKSTKSTLSLLVVLALTALALSGCSSPSSPPAGGPGAADGQESSGDSTPTSNAPVDATGPYDLKGDFQWNGQRNVYELWIMAATEENRNGEKAPGAYTLRLSNLTYDDAIAAARDGAPSAEGFGGITFTSTYDLTADDFEYPNNGGWKARVDVSPSEIPLIWERKCEGTMTFDGETSCISYADFYGHVKWRDARQHLANSNGFDWRPSPISYHPLKDRYDLQVLDWTVEELENREKRLVINVAITCIGVGNDAITSGSFVAKDAEGNGWGSMAGVISRTEPDLLDDGEPDVFQCDRGKGSWDSRFIWESPYSVRNTPAQLSYSWAVYDAWMVASWGLE